jgi:hypothetical protein
MLLTEVNPFTEKPINQLMALNISNASFVWGRVGDEKEGMQLKKKRKKSLSKSRPL